MDPKEGNKLISRISSKEKIPLSKEGHRIMDKEMARTGVMDGTIKNFASS
jgi:hypothetical protein